jgi:hypothetical protein
VKVTWHCFDLSSGVSLSRFVSPRFDRAVDVPPVTYSYRAPNFLCHVSSFGFVLARLHLARDHCLARD